MPSILDLVRDPISIAMFALILLIYAWESFLPARALPRVAGWRVRTLVAFVSYFVISSYLPLLIGGLLAPLAIVDATSFGTLGGAALALLVYDLLSYAWHRSLHGSNVMWRGLHQMHHSAERLDVPSAFWFSPLDVAGWTLVSTVTLTLVGLSPAAMAVFVLVTTFFGVFQHANIATPMWLGYIMQRPENHARHHARGLHAKNYANFSIIDMIFGTFANEPTFVAQTGFGEGASSRVFEMLTFRDVTRPRKPSARRAADRALERTEALLVLRRRELHRAAEQAGEERRVLVPDLASDVVDRRVVGLEHVLGRLDAQRVHVLEGTHAGRGLEAPLEGPLR